MPPSLKILQGDCREQLRTLPADSIDCCVTSPPYWGLRDYGHEGQLGQEKSPQEYIERMVEVFEEVRRVLRPDGTLWLNLGDTFAGSGRGAGDVHSGNRGNPNSRTGSRVPCGFHENARKGGAIGRAWVPPPLGLKQKDLCMIPHRVAMALQQAGWWVRMDNVWSKPNPMPESVEDRPTKAHEYIFLLAKSADYHYDADAIAEPAEYGSKGSHFDKGKTGQHQLGRSSRKPRVSKVRGEFEGKTNSLPGREAFRAITETRNKRSVWTVASQPYAGAHFATFPPELIKPCILAGCPRGGVVLDPFGGSGTTGAVALELDRSAVLCELNPAYVRLIRQRCEKSRPHWAAPVAQELPADDLPLFAQA